MHMLQTTQATTILPGFWSMSLHSSQPSLERTTFFPPQDCYGLFLHWSCENSPEAICSWKFCISLIVLISSSQYSFERDLEKFGVILMVHWQPAYVRTKQNIFITIHWHILSHHQQSGEYTFMQNMPIHRLMHILHIFGYF